MISRRARLSPASKYVSTTASQHCTIDLTRFIRCARLLKDDICLPQPHTVPVNVASGLLPPEVITFLAQLFAISYEAMHYL
jgi:hypothetical protein